MTRRTTIRTLARVSAVVMMSLVLGIYGLAPQPARAGAGTELVGFPSDPVEGAEPGLFDAAPACQSEAPEPVHLLATNTPKPKPAPRAPRAVYVVPATPATPAAPNARRTRGRRSDVRTDTTFAVKAGSRLALNNFGGSIDIKTWSKNAVHVQAEHSRRDWIVVEQEGPEVRVVSSSRYGPAQAVEYMITVPAWMAVGLSGVYNDVNADGMQGGLNVETVRGDIVVRRVGGVIELRSVEGIVDLVGAKGKITVSSVNEAVRVASATGDVAAEAVNGDIHMVDINSQSVEATTVNGAVIYEGRILDGGDYRFATHNGDIALALSEKASANVTVSTFSGEFESAFPVKLTGTKRGKRFNFVLGGGKAQIDLESFQGEIQLLRIGSHELRTRINQAWQERENEYAKEWKWDSKEWKWEMKGHDAPDPEDTDVDE